MSSQQQQYPNQFNNFAQFNNNHKVILTLNNDTTSTDGTRRDSVGEVKRYLSNDDSERENSIGSKTPCPNVSTASTTPSTTANSSGRASPTNGSSSSRNPSSWDPEDDLLLRHLKEIKKLGWKEISRFFENRTPNACQFRWRRLKSGNLKSNKTALVDVTDYDEVLKALRFGKLNEYMRTAAPMPAPPVVPTSGSTTVKDPTNSTISSSSLSPGNSKTGKLPLTSNPTSGEVSPLVNPSGPTDAITVNGDVSGLSPRKTLSPIGGGMDNLMLSPPRGKLPLPSTISSNTTINSKKFVKPRSFSSNIPKRRNSVQVDHILTRDAATNLHLNPAPNEENIGFIPKIVIRSRRSSSSYILPPFGTTYSNAINSRKNSISVLSRRSSFTNSRRASLMVVPGVINEHFSYNIVPSQRKNSLALARVVSPGSSVTSIHTSAVPPTTIIGNDNNSNNINTNNNNTTSITTAVVPPRGYVDDVNSSRNCHWRPDEDRLIIENSTRRLSISELAIVLQDKSEEQIKSRMDYWSSQGRAPREEAGVDPLHVHKPRLPSISDILNGG